VCFGHATTGRTYGSFSVRNFTQDSAWDSFNMVFREESYRSDFVSASGISDRVRSVPEHLGQDALAWDCRFGSAGLKPDGRAVCIGG
jgi:hypothetical protein